MFELTGNKLEYLSRLFMGKRCCACRVCCSSTNRIDAAARSKFRGLPAQVKDVVTILSFRRRRSGHISLQYSDNGKDWLCDPCYKDLAKFRAAIDNKEIPTYVPSSKALDGTQALAIKFGVELVIMPGEFGSRLELQKEEHKPSCQHHSQVITRFPIEKIMVSRCCGGDCWDGAPLRPEAICNRVLLEHRSYPHNRQCA